MHCRPLPSPSPLCRQLPARVMPPADARALLPPAARRWLQEISADIAGTDSGYAPLPQPANVASPAAQPAAALKLNWDLSPSLEAAVDEAERAFQVGARSGTRARPPHSACTCHLNLTSSNLPAPTSIWTPEGRDRQSVERGARLRSLRQEHYQDVEDGAGWSGAGARRAGQPCHAHAVLSWCWCWCWCCWLGLVLVWALCDLLRIPLAGHALAPPPGLPRWRCSWRSRGCTAG